MPQCQQLLRQGNNRSESCPRSANYLVAIRRVPGWRYRCGYCLAQERLDGIVEVASPIPSTYSPIPDSPQTDLPHPGPV